jgi:Na+-translocating ferredoxin:NAD+ oxidoreductase RnfC subunit
LRANDQIITSGIVTVGKRIAIVPYAQRQFILLKDSESGAPANAMIIYGDEVKANARARSCTLDVSAVNTSTQNIRPAKPTVTKAFEYL